MLAGADSRSKSLMSKERPSKNQRLRESRINESRALFSANAHMNEIQPDASGNGIEEDDYAGVHLGRCPNPACGLLMHHTCVMSSAPGGDQQCPICKVEVQLGEQWCTGHNCGIGVAFSKSSTLLVMTTPLSGAL